MTFSVSRPETAARSGFVGDRAHRAAGARAREEKVQCASATIRVSAIDRDMPLGWMRRHQRAPSAAHPLDRDRSGPKPQIADRERKINATPKEEITV